MVICWDRHAQGRHAAVRVGDGRGAVSLLGVGGCKAHMLLCKCVPILYSILCKAHVLLFHVGQTLTEANIREEQQENSIIDVLLLYCTIVLSSLTLCFPEMETS